MKDFQFAFLSDPACFREGCVKPHSYHAHFRTEEEALAGKSSFYHDLNGAWKFHYAANYAQTIPDFMQTSYDCHAWADIMVPGHIQMQGYDKPQYVNIQYPWEGHEAVDLGKAPVDFNPVASYVKYVELVDVSERTFFVMEGVESAAALWVNGTFLGYHEDSFTTAEWEITEALRAGVNKIAVQVFKWCSGSWFEDQDFFRFSGIFRDTYLYTVPKTHIEDIKVQSVLSKDMQTADVTVTLRLSGSDTVRVELRDEDTVLSTQELFGSKQRVFQFKIDKPMLWSAEMPFLYDLKFEVTDVNGNVLEVVKETFGVRRFTIEDGVMKLNGKRIVFKGVNRHEFRASVGRAVTREMILQDLLTMKRNNINAVRTCHYPNNPFLYRMCDALGLYVIDETNMETHGTWGYPGEVDESRVLPKDEQVYKSLLLARCEAMYERDKNHPCILLWSCGNESYGGSVIHAMSQYFHSVDDSRLVHYEGVYWDPVYPDTTDVYSRMYAPVTEIEDYLREHRDKPYINCEYAHAMGNSLGAIYKYTDLTRSDPLYQGGFIWDFIDQAVLTKNAYGEQYLGYGGAFGERPHDGAFSGDGLLFADGTPSPKLQEVKKVYQDLQIKVGKDSVSIFNEALFTDASTYECIVQIVLDGDVLLEDTLEVTLAPLEKRVIDISTLTAECSLPGEYAITVSFHLKNAMPWAPAGYEVAFAQGVFTVEEKKGDGKTDTGKKPVLVETPFVVGVHGEGFEVLFSKLEGGLISYVWQGRELIDGMVKPSFWRSPISNDDGAKLPARLGQWKLASKYLHIFEGDPPMQILPEIVEKKETISVKFTYILPMEPIGRCTVTYTVHGDGTVEVLEEMPWVKGMPRMPEFSMTFTMVKDFDTVSWYGLGPEENYPDRLQGARLARYSGKVSDQLTPYLVPQESGAKCGVRYAAVTDLTGRGLMFERCDQENPFMFSAMPHSVHTIEEAAYAYELPRVHHTYVRVIAAQMGVGGDDSWGAIPHPEFMLKETDQRFRFRFRGI